MYCKSCGKQIDNDSTFCTYCGTKQSVINVSEIINHNSKLQVLEGKINQQDRKFTYNFQPKYDVTYTKEHEATFLGIVLVCLSIFLIIIQPFKFDDTESYNNFKILSSLAAVVGRIFITIWVVNIAKRQNREPSIWGILAFFVPSIILIIIGQQNKIYEKFDINENLSPEENSENLASTANSYLNDKKYNNAIRFAEKALELNSKNDFAEEILTKARLEIKVNEITNRDTQIVYRQTKDNQILKIISKNYNSIGAEVFIGKNFAPDGEYFYLKNNTKLIIKNGKIEEII